MPVDRVTKTLLALILVALCVLIFRQGPGSALAQTPAPAPAMPQSAATSLAGDGTVNVVANGYLSVWVVRQDKTGKNHLMLVDEKPLPPLAK